jgi:hypothetical protein
MVIKGYLTDMLLIEVRYRPSTCLGVLIFHDSVHRRTLLSFHRFCKSFYNPQNSIEYRNGNTKCNFPSDIEAQSSNGLIDIELARQPMLTPVQASGSLVPMDQGPRWDDNSID